MYDKMIILSPFFIPPKQIKKEGKDKEVAKLVITSFFITSK